MRCHVAAGAAPEQDAGGTRLPRAVITAMALVEGCSVRIHGVRARPELNGTLGTVISIDQSRGRCGVFQAGTGTRVSLRMACLERSHPEGPWDRCRHGGPPMEPSQMQHVTAFVDAATPITAPCLEHVRLLEPLLLGSAAPIPVIVVASMAVDAYVEADFGPCRRFAVCALVLDAARQMGAAELFARLASRPYPPHIQRLEARLAKCRSLAGLYEVLEELTTCDCLKIARERGIGLTHADLEPRPSPVDPAFDAADHAELPPSEEAELDGARVGVMALELLEPGARASVDRK